MIPFFSVSEISSSISLTEVLRILFIMCTLIDFSGSQMILPIQALTKEQMIKVIEYKISTFFFKNKIKNFTLSPIH